MKPFPLALLTHHQPKPLLRPEYEWLSVVVALATLGIGFPLAFLLALSLAWMLGIPAGQPINAQPAGTLWAMLSLAGLVPSVLVGYLASFALLGVVLRTCYGWTWPRVGELLFASRLPSHWAAAPVSLAADGSGGPGDAQARARFTAQSDIFRKKLRTWLCFAGLAAILCQVARFGYRRGSWVDVHGLLTTLLLLAFACLVILLLGFWHIVRRHAPRCAHCRRPLAGRQTLQALASDQCPFCRQPVFGEGRQDCRGKV